MHSDINFIILEALKRILLKKSGEILLIVVEMAKSRIYSDIDFSMLETPEGEVTKEIERNLFNVIELEKMLKLILPSISLC